jgi:hypothetical protein
MINRGWRVGLPQQTQVTIERKYDRTSGRELTHAEAVCADRINMLEYTIDELKQELRNVNNENTAIRQRVIKAELIVNELERASESSHTKNPYPKTKTTSKSLNTELANFCLFYNIKLDFPNEFLCPITHRIMVDPVTTSGGHTYEWSAISQWFRQKNNTDPATGLELNNNILYPNHALRSAIRNFIPTCELIITDVPKKTQGSIRMRSAPAAYGTRSRLVSKTRTQSKVKALSKSRSSSTAKSRARETAPSSQRFIQELDAPE